MNIVHAVAMATACSSCTNLVERLLAVCQTLGGYVAIEHQNGNIVPGDLTAQLGRKPIEPVGFQNT